MPETTVAIIAMRFENDVGEILLVKRNRDPFKGFWCLPGGHVEKNEKVVDAIVRELKEETGLVAKGDLEFVTVADEIYPDLRNRTEEGIHNVVVAFVATVSGEIKLNVEMQEYIWIDGDEAVKMALAFGQEKLIRAYLEDQSAIGC
jgi:8-oxo-dGTP diphosphatase